MVETLLRTTALCDAHRNPRQGRLCRPRVPSKVEDEVEHPAVDGRHGVPEQPRWNETPPAFGHDCRRLDTRFYEDASCQWQGNQHPWCRHPSILRQVTIWGAAGNEADHIHHRQLWQTVPESRGMYLSWHDNCEIPNGWRGDEPLMPTAFMRWEHGWDRHGHTQVWLPTETETTPCANQTSLCCTRGKQIKTAGISTHRARSSPANISCYPWCKDHHSNSWSTLTPPQWPTTPQSQSLGIGRRKSKPGWTAMFDSVWSSQSPLATQWHIATGW